MNETSAGQLQKEWLAAIIGLMLGGMLFVAVAAGVIIHTGVLENPDANKNASANVRSNNARRNF